MQQRFHISYHPDYDSAQAAKKEIETARPNEYFQIRKRKNNFDLVGRVTVTQALKFEKNNPQMYSKKKKPKKAWKKSLVQDEKGEWVEQPPFKYEYRNAESRAIGRGKWTPINPFAQLLKGEESLNQSRE